MTIIKKIINGIEYTFVSNDAIENRYGVVDMNAGYTQMTEPTDFGDIEATSKPLTVPTIKIKTLDEVFDLEPQWGGQVVECEEDGKLYQYVGWQELEFENNQ